MPVADMPVAEMPVAEMPASKSCFICVPRYGTNCRREVLPDMDQTHPLAAISQAAAKPRANPSARTWVRVLLTAIVVILIILIAIVTPRVRDYELFLSGFWSGEPTFLKEAGLSEMYLYISPCERSGGRWCRQGYLVMVDLGGAVVSNQGIEMEWSGLAGRWKSALKSNFSGGAHETYHIPEGEFSYDDESVMPEKMRMGLNVTEGTLALYTDENIIYAFFVKDNEASIAANEEYCTDGSMPTGS